MTRLSRKFYQRDATTLARALLGQVLVRVLDDGTRLAGRIIETEAYLGVEDKAAHSYGGRHTPRNAAMWGPAGHAYVYFIYGMHYCMNVVARRPGAPEAVLLRGLEPLEGLEFMRARRAGRIPAVRLEPRDLCSGPARLAQALAIDRALDHADLVTGEALFIERGRRVPPDRIVATPRIGVGYAEEWAQQPLRFVLAGA
ncbi:DNA-3-methyladenine glycosylase [Thioalkalivibrio sp. XN8]|uniref:DNA-3-methyladenine glycosylase n=1 Tax=Thioalkalivibrio sp. XN8 TaxID=2712863 RepID=UPI0013EA6CA3|nr:DNA-3-methyladenine glycosylase [Thioalkalivibrio sp. XN8]